MTSDSNASEKMEWEQAVCSVCLDAPHKAVLLLCASHDKGCRPYMCGTNFRHSNCFNLFKKSHVKPVKSELSCPLCRGKVEGWSVVNAARQYLNRKRRSCMMDGCSFTGTYKELNEHVKANHHISKPGKVDPSLEARWRVLENQTSEQDVLSTVRSVMPGTVVEGDYVIERESDSSKTDNDSSETDRDGRETDSDSSEMNDSDDDHDHFPPIQVANPVIRVRIGDSPRWRPLGVRGGATYAPFPLWRRHPDLAPLPTRPLRWRHHDLSHLPYPLQRARRNPTRAYS